MTTPDPSVLLDLAEACERATRPDRELDLAIFHGAFLDDELVRLGADSCFCAMDGSSYGFNFDDRPSGQKVKWCGAVPRYTASIDAAMTLVPEGLEWIVSNQRTRRLPNNLPEHFNGWAGIYGPPMIGSECDSFAATPALALCAAALCARSTDTGE